MSNPTEPIAQSVELINIVGGMHPTWLRTVPGHFSEQAYTDLLCYDGHAFDGDPGYAPGYTGLVEIHASAGQGGFRLQPHTKAGGRRGLKSSLATSATTPIPTSCATAVVTTCSRSTM